jgi:hypothetical protein
MAGKTRHPTAARDQERPHGHQSAPSDGPADITDSARDGLREILITVSPAQFEALAGDLRLLRAHGAASNTQAIIDAVRERAARVKVGAVAERKAV